MVEVKLLKYVAFLVALLFIYFINVQYFDHLWFHGAFANDAGTKRAREWFKAPTDEVNLGKKEGLRWEPVPERNQARAEMKLAGNSLARLKQEDADELLGVRVKADGHPYLFRGIDSVRRRSNFWVERYRESIWVSGTAVSGRSVQLRRKCVVAWLEEEPREVYVTFGVAE
jgi:hypothetical protein